MNSEAKLAGIVQSLQQAGIETLVMGGHAVRYYGIDRNTIDYDLATFLTSPDDLQQRLPAIERFHDVHPVPAWRNRDFARFEIGRLPDARNIWSSGCGTTCWIISLNSGNAQKSAFMVGNKFRFFPSPI